MSRLNDLMVNIRDRLSDVSDRPRWSDNHLLRLIDKAQLTIGSYAGLLNKDVIIFLKENENIYVLPDDCYRATRFLDVDFTVIPVYSHERVDNELKTLQLQNNQRVVKNGYVTNDTLSQTWENDVGNSIKAVIFDKITPNSIKIYPKLDLPDEILYEYKADSSYGVVTDIDDFTEVELLDNQVVSIDVAVESNGEIFFVTQQKGLHNGVDANVVLSPNNVADVADIDEISIYTDDVDYLAALKSLGPKLDDGDIAYIQFTEVNGLREYTFAATLLRDSGNNYVDFEGSVTKYSCNSNLVDGSGTDYGNACNLLQFKKILGVSLSEIKTFSDVPFNSGYTLSIITASAITNESLIYSSGFGIVSELSLIDEDIEIEFPLYGIITDIEELTVTPLQVNYWKQPERIKSLTDDLEIAPIFDIAIEHTVVSQAFMDNIDTLSRQLSRDYSGKYEREMARLTTEKDQNYTKVQTQFKSSYYNGFN